MLYAEFSPSMPSFEIFMFMQHNTIMLFNPYLAE